MSEAHDALDLIEYLETTEKADAVIIGLTDAELIAKALRALVGNLTKDSWFCDAETG